MRRTGPTISGFKDERRGPQVMEHEWILVLKCRFHHDPGMMRPTDQEMIATEKSLLSSQIPRGLGMPNHSGGRGDTGHTKAV